MIYNADSILKNTPFSTELILKLTVELYIFLWGNDPAYGINWNLFSTDNDSIYLIPVHILLINSEYRLFLGNEEELPEHTFKVSKSAIKGLNFDKCGSLVFDMLMEMHN